VHGKLSRLQWITEKLRPTNQESHPACLPPQRPPWLSNSPSQLLQDRPSTLQPLEKLKPPPRCPISFPQMSRKCLRQGPEPGPQAKPGQGTEARAGSQGWPKSGSSLTTIPAVLPPRREVPGHWAQSGHPGEAAVPGAGSAMGTAELSPEVVCIYA